MNKERLHQLFPIKDRWAYFMSAANGPLSVPVLNRLNAFNKELVMEGCDNYMSWLKQVEDTRRLSSRLLDCSPDNIAFVKNTAAGLWIASRMIDWKRGDEIILPRGEFPSNTFPWLSLEPQGVIIRWLDMRSDKNDPKLVTPDEVSRLISPRTRALSVSFVQYDDGCRRDVVELGRLCNDFGITFVIDAIQGLGAIPLSATECQADFISSGAHKWLMCPPGAGILYVKSDWLAKENVPNLGWLSVADPFNFETASYKEIVERLSPGAKRFEEATSNFSGIFALNESLSLILDQGIPEISREIERLTSQLVDGLNTLGCSVVSPREKNQWSGIVSFFAPGVDSDELQNKLRENNVLVTVRQGWVRVAVHFFNDQTEITKLLEVVARSMPSRTAV